LLHLLVARLEGRLDAALEQLDRAAGSMLELEQAQLDRAVERLLPGDAIAFVGRGPCCGSARQCALTFMEGAHCLGAAFSGGAFRHGPLEAAGERMRAFFLLAAGPSRELGARLARETARLGAGVVAITDDERDLDGVVTVRVARGEREGEALFPLAAAGAHALLLEQLARARGIEPGEFRHGAKITTRE